MNLDQLQQEANNLELLDITNLSPEQLEQLVKKLELMLDTGETLLAETETQLNEINTEDEPDNS